MYACVVGSLMYDMVRTRPDLSLAFGAIDRYMHNLGKGRCLVVKEILRYLLQSLALLDPMSLRDPDFYPCMRKMNNPDAFTVHAHDHAFTVHTATNQVQRMCVCADVLLCANRGLKDAGLISYIP